MKKKAKKEESRVVYTKDGLMDILGVDKYSELNSNGEFGQEELIYSGDMYITIYRESRFSENALKEVRHATK